MQVLALTPEQINGLPESERAAIMQLVGFYVLCFCKRDVRLMPVKSR